jgi:hypothetical protein
MSQTSRNTSPQPDRKVDELESLLAGILGMGLVILATGVAYYLIMTSAPWDTNDTTKGGVHIGLWVGGILGTMFLLWGAVGILKGEIVVGWGTYNQVRTTIKGAGAFIASFSTALGGVLFLCVAAVSLIPEVGTIIHPLGAMLSAFVTIFGGWICGLIVRSLGY